VLSDEGEHVFDVVARINYDGFAGEVIADHGAVALERPNGKDFVNHGAVKE